MGWTGSIFCGLLAAFAPAVCPAAVYTYAAADKASNGADATINGTADTRDVWAVYTNGNEDDAVSNSDADVFPGLSGTNGTGSSSGAGAGNQAWGFQLTENISQIFARASITGLVDRPLVNPGDSVSIDFDNGLVDVIVGITFFNNDPNTGNQTALVLSGGDDPHYTLIDDDPPSLLTTDIAATADGFNLKLTLLDDPGTYEIVIDKHDGNPYHSPPRMLTDHTSTIASIEVASAAGGGADHDYNVYFNNLVITTVPEISSAVAMPVAFATVGLSAWFGRRLRRRAATQSLSAELQAVNALRGFSSCLARPRCGRPRT
jgi:hypothetical protein